MHPECLVYTLRTFTGGLSGFEVTSYFNIIYIGSVATLSITQVLVTPPKPLMLPIVLKLEFINMRLITQPNKTASSLDAFKLT